MHVKISPFKIGGRTALAAAALALFLAGCSSGGGFVPTVKRSAFTSSEYGVAVSPRMSRDPNPPKGGGRYLLGKPYTVKGKVYIPADDPYYVATGTASWYGADFHGRQTANGEIFSANGLSAAHPTLPIPSYVRVTNLQNGRSIVVRINDRGPYVAGRIIDLSWKAASLLGYDHQGSTNVKVEYVGKAPLNGDDTRYLMASLTGAPAGAGGGGRNRTSLMDMAGDLFSNMFAYADGTPLPDDGSISTAHQAALAMATQSPELTAWAATIDETARAVNIPLGTFTDQAGLDLAASSFAMLGAVDQKAVAGNGRAGVALTLTHLKPGVALDDVKAMATQLGLGGIVLY